MPLESRLEELNRKHSALEKTIEECERTPSTDPLHIRALKKKKLQLKEQIETVKEDMQANKQRP